MTAKICAVLPIKDTALSKQRLAALLSPVQRRALVLAMAEDLLRTLVQVRELADILVVTADPAAAELAGRFGVRVSSEQACSGHTAAVTAAAQRLASKSVEMLAVPGDIPLVKTDDIRQLIAARRAVPFFTIVPSRDEMGTNAVLCSPADAVPLRFGENSFFPHLAAAKARGLGPQVVNLPRIALDLDTPDDLARFLGIPSRTRTRRLLDHWDVHAHAMARHAKAGP